METTNLSRKERERLFRRKEIIEASVELFATKGFNSTTLDEIAEAAEFGKGTLYNYFEGKQEIYTAIIEEVLENDLKIIKEADNNSGDAVEFLENYTNGIVTYCVENKFSFLIFVREIAQLDSTHSITNMDNFKEKHKEKHNIFSNRIKKGIKSGKLGNFETEKLVTIYVHMVFPYIHHLIICRNDEIDIKKEVDLILNVLFKGILKK